MLDSLDGQVAAILAYMWTHPLVAKVAHGHDHSTLECEYFAEHQID